MITAIYILWFALNVVLGIFFLYLCVNAVKLVRYEFGLFAAIVLVIGILSFASHSNNSSDRSGIPETKPSTFFPADSMEHNSIDHIPIELEKTGISKYMLWITYGKYKGTENYAPINAFSGTDGFTGGTNWVPLSPVVNASDDSSRLSYSINGMVEWQLLGLTIFTQHKSYEGRVSIK